MIGIAILSGGLLVLGLVAYYASIIGELRYGIEYKTKKEFIGDLVPYRAWFRRILEKWNNLK